MNSLNTNSLPQVGVAILLYTYTTAVTDAINYYIVNYYMLLTLEYRLVERKDNELLSAKFGDGIPDVRDLAKNIRLLLVNQHFSISGSRPLPPHVIEIGGVHLLPEKQIPSVNISAINL